MEPKDFLAFIVNEIHTTVTATVDDDGLPVTAAIDMMDSDEGGLYFLTAKGKSFYDRLKKRGFLALTAIRGEDTMRSVAVSVRGRVRELGPELLPRLFEKNPYMAEIYPAEASRTALTVFKLYEGAGEWFDLSKKPIERAQFTFGGEDPVDPANPAEDAERADRTAPDALTETGYRITDACVGCGTCLGVCPQQCIDDSDVPFTIRSENCLRCGNCFELCPAGAVKKGR